MRTLCVLVPLVVLAGCASVRPTRIEVLKHEPDGLWLVREAVESDGVRSKTLKVLFFCRKPQAAALPPHCWAPIYHHGREMDTRWPEGMEMLPASPPATTAP